MRHLCSTVAILVPMLLAGCGGRECRDLPLELRGRWTTADPAHSGRHLELRFGEVEFGTGGGETSRHTVVCVAPAGESRPGLVGYDIVYLSAEDEEYTLALSHDRSRQRLYLRHREGVEWAKSGETGGG